MRICSFVLFFLLLSSIVYAGGAFDPKSYNETELAKIKATPEEYKNKKICYISKYKGYITSFPPYIEKSGFKAGKYYLLEISPVIVPVMVKKTDEMNEIIPTLPRGKGVKIYGKIDKFRIEPEFTVLPRFYLDLDHIEVLEGDPVVQDIKDDKIDFNQKQNKQEEPPVNAPNQLPFQKKKFNR